MIPNIAPNNPGMNLPKFVMQNVRGLAVSNKHARPFSNDGRWLSLSAVAGDADLVALVETQVHEVGFRSSLFFPMGRSLKPQIYSCYGKSNGIFIFEKKNYIEELDKTFENWNVVWKTKNEKTLKCCNVVMLDNVVFTPTEKKIEKKKWKKKKNLLNFFDFFFTPGV